MNTDFQNLTRAWGSNEDGLNLNMAEDRNAPGEPHKLCHEVRKGHRYQNRWCFHSLRKVALTDLTLHRLIHPFYVFLCFFIPNFLTFKAILYPENMPKAKISTFHLGSTWVLKMFESQPEDVLVWLQITSIGCKIGSSWSSLFDV